MRIACLILLVSTVAGADSTAEIAEDVLTEQLPQVPQQFADDDAHQRARYTKDAVLLGNYESTVGETPVDYVRLMAPFGSTQIDRSRIASLVAGGDQNTVWFTSDVAVDYSGTAEGAHEFHGSGTQRITQIAVLDGTSWKVVASLSGNEHGSPFGGSPHEIAGATESGPLAQLIASPKAIAAALSADPHTFAIGTEKAERAIGPAAAKKLLTSWAKLSLVVDGKVREVETKSYAFVQGHVKWTKGKATHWMDAMLVAVPAPDGAWKVVGIHYANLS